MFGRRKKHVSHEDENAKKIADLIRSRRAVVDAYEIELQRIERNLHDGTQQYLVAAAMKLGEAQLSPSLSADLQLASLISEAKDAVRQGLDSLRETVRGIHPQVLLELGLVAAINDIAGKSGGKVRVICPNPLPELPEGVLAAAYFFASEAIANSAKHAPEASVSALITSGENLSVSVVDDGPGGAHLKQGHGLAGLRERLAAFGGTLTISSPPGGPTRVSAELPLLVERWQPTINLAQKNGEKNE